MTSKQWWCRSVDIVLISTVNTRLSFELGFSPAKCPVSSDGWKECEELEQCKVQIIRARRMAGRSFAFDSQPGGEKVDYFLCVCEISSGLFLLLKVNWLKEQGEQYIKLGWVRLWSGSRRRWQAAHSDSQLAAWPVADSDPCWNNWKWLYATLL